MRRSKTVQIRDSRVGAIIASQWNVPTRDDQDVAADTALTAMPESPGLVGFSVFGGVDDTTMFVLSQWVDDTYRDAYLSVSSTQRAAVDEALPMIDRRWRCFGSPYRSFVGPQEELGCLVVVRQAFLGPDPDAQRDWSDAVINALRSGPMPGLRAATFFPSGDGTVVLNIAEWASADAHREALTRGTIGRHHGLDETDEWKAVRGYPGTADADVRRYELIGAIKP